MNWMFIMSIIYLWIKALYVMSLRRPTAAFLLNPFMWCRLDARLCHAFYLFTFRGVAPDTRSVFSYLFLFIKSCNNIIVGMSIIIFIHDAFMHSLIISFVRTVLRVLSSTHLACWFGQMLMKAISRMKSLIASPTPRGVPVSPVWSCFGHCTIRFRKPRINSSSLPDARWAAS